MEKTLTQQEALVHIKRLLDLRPSSVKLLKAMLQEADHNHTFCTTYQELSRKFNIKSYSTVARMIEQLDETGLVIKDRLGNRGTVLTLSTPALRKPRMKLYLDIGYAGDEKTRSTIPPHNINNIPLPTPQPNNNLYNNQVDETQPSLNKTRPEPAPSSLCFPCAATDAEDIAISPDGVVELRGGEAGGNG